MGLLRVMMPPKLQLLALLTFAVAMFFLENQIQKLEESRGKLGKFACSDLSLSLAFYPRGRYKPPLQEAVCKCTSPQSRQWHDMWGAVLLNLAPLVRPEYCTW